MAELDPGGGGGVGEAPEPEPPDGSTLNPADWLATVEIFGQEVHAPNLPKIFLAVLSGFILLFWEVPITFIQVVAAVVADTMSVPLDEWGNTLSLFWSEPTTALNQAFDSAATSLSSVDPLLGWVFAIIIVIAFFEAVSWVWRFSFGGDD